MLDSRVSVRIQTDREQPKKEIHVHIETSPSRKPVDLEYSTVLQYFNGNDILSLVAQE